MTVESAKIAAEIAAWHGVSVARITQGGKHRRLYLKYGATERFVTFPCSASDRRAEANQIRDLRKTLTEMGARRAQRRKATVKRERNKPDRDALANVALAPVKGDPWAALASVVIAEPRKSIPTRRAETWNRLRSWVARSLKAMRPKGAA